jgi:glyoxylase-like metal-dependent hydrolase (beta-lactamase superfamily II)
MIHTPHDIPPEPGQATLIAEDVLWLRMPLPMVLNHVNAYALRDADGWTLIDTGFDTAHTRALWDAALVGPLAGAPIRRVVVTHHHPDHVGLAGWFQARGAELCMPRTAWLMARMLVLDEHPRPTAETLAHWQDAGMDPALLARRRDERPFNFCDVVHALPLGFRRLQSGATIRMGGRDWDIRFGQGHAPDHATFWSRDDNLVIGGDQLLATISPNLGVYATEPGADPVGEWLQSCAELLPWARPDQLVLPGHKLPFLGLPDRLGQLIDNHHGALDRLRDHLSAGPRSAAECFAPLFKRNIDAASYGLALVEAVAHLNHLLALGAVTRQRRADGAWAYRLAD